MAVSGATTSEIDADNSLSVGFAADGTDVERAATWGSAIRTGPGAAASSSSPQSESISSVGGIIDCRDAAASEVLATIGAGSEAAFNGATPAPAGAGTASDTVVTGGVDVAAVLGCSDADCRRFDLALGARLLIAVGRHASANGGVVARLERGQGSVCGCRCGGVHSLPITSDGFGPLRTKNSKLTAI